jgi:Cdc6-like AAA superfamily ATPase
MNMNVDQIKELIKNHNPFAGQTIVKSHQIWENTFADVPTINNHVSDIVFSALELINSGKRQSVIGITIVGDKGIGKTQVISRIRHHLQQKPEKPEKKGIFIYVGEYSGTNIKSVFLKKLSESMKKTGSMDRITQWQEIATHLLNETFSDKDYSPYQYINHFTEKPDLNIEEGIKEFDLEKRIQEFNFKKRIQRILQVRSDINDLYLIKGILLTLIPKYSDYAVRWLAGQELTQAQLEAMDLPPVKDNAGEAFNQACELLKIISKYKTPVICFDELDSINDDVTPSGKTLSQIVASLGKELSNSLERCILLFAMYPLTWKDEIESLPRTDAIVDRIADYPHQGEPIALNPLKGDQILELVKTWLNNFYQKHNINPTDPLYPFEEDDLINLGRERLNARKVLNWCADKWSSLTFSSEQQVSENITVTDNKANITSDQAGKEHNLVKIAFTSELEEVNSKIDSLIDDNQAIAISDALGFCFHHLVGETIDHFKIEKFELLPKTKLCFKIIGLDNDAPITIGVAVAQHSNMQSLGAVLKQLVDYQKYQFTRGCLVRSKDTSPGARGVKTDLGILLNEKGGKRVNFNADDISQIIALRELYKDRQDYDLTEEQIWQFAKQEKIITENYLVKEILSAPPGKKPDNLTDEDADL